MGMQGWTGFLAAFMLTLVRVSGLVAFAPFFSANALPMRAKATLALAIAYLLAPFVASLPGERTLSFSSLLSELAVGLVFGLILALMNEMLLFAGQVAGLQFSFSLVNLLDPASSIQTPLLGELFQLLGTLVIITAGLDRILLASLARGFQAVPPGSYVLTQTTAQATIRAAAGVFLAAVELTAPILACTVTVEIAIALLGKLSPQLPSMALTIPLKTLVGMAVLAGSLALWPRFIEARFEGLLNLADHLLFASALGR